MPTKLGQNFLKDSNVLQKIIQSSCLKASDTIIEIGPGEGVLTEELAKKAKQVIAIELDNKLFKNLQEKFKNQKNIHILNEDILKTNLPELLKKYTFNDYKVVANIPYYITSPIIQLFLETIFPPKEMVLMIQKEVAERICAKIGQMSILAVSVQYRAKPELLFLVDKSSFNPAPKVDSAVIKISKIETQKKENTKKFFRTVKAGFCAKRKTLINNLSSSLQIDKKQIEQILKEIDIKPNQRAQELSIEHWKKLAILLK